jgi:hypothetical protein
MADVETSRTNVLLQRAGFGLFLAILAAMGTLLLLEHLGLAVNINQGWNALGSRPSLALAPDGLRPGQTPALDSTLLADANLVGEAADAPFVAVEGYHVYLRPRGETTGLGDALVYVVRDVRGAQSSFAVPLRVYRSQGVWVDHLKMRQWRTTVPADAAVSPTAACVHAPDAEVGICRLLQGSGRQAWECRCTTAGALVP